MTLTETRTPPGYEVVRLVPTGSSNRGGGWPQPVPIVSTLPPVQRFHAGLLPNPLHYVFDIAERQQSPADFAAVTTLCGLASLIGNRVRIAPKTHDDWVVVPNLWGAIIGPPSAMKSPAMQAALAPLYAMQDEFRKAWEDEAKEQGIESKIAALQAKEAVKNAHKAIKSGDAESARAMLTDAAGGDDDPDPCPRLIVNDASVEKLGELLNENPRGLLLIRDELPGFLAKMESEEYASDRAFYLEAYNGDGRFTYDRIGRGTVHITNCTLSMIGGIQPSRIIPIVRGAVTGATNDGLIQRLQLAVWPDTGKTWKWVDRPPHGHQRDAFRDVFHKLNDTLPGSPENPGVMRFSPEAQDAFQAWMTAIQNEARAGDLPSTLESHLLKMPKTVASLALIFELVDGGRFEVGIAATERALSWANYLRTHADRLYAAGGTMAEDAARLVIERRHLLPTTFTARDVHRKGWTGLVDANSVSEAISLLVETHHCRAEHIASGPQGGRSTQTFEWHPSLRAEG